MRRVYVMLGALLLSASAHAADWFENADGVVLDGYDVVSYFEDGGPVAGQAKFAVEHEGGTFHFSSARHKDAFEADPARYAPHYKGWCAYAVGANNVLVKSNPRTFTVRDGKLLLFYNAWGNNTLTRWNADPDGLWARAEANWPALDAAD